MGRTLPGQLTQPQETGNTRGQRPRDTWDPRSCVGRLPSHSRALSPPQRTAKAAGHSPQPAPAVPAAPCAHRTPGLRISRPGGRGYRARILSHRARSQGSTTASGLQVGNTGCSSTASAPQPQELPPCTQTVRGRPRAAASAPPSLHSHRSPPASATPSTCPLTGPKP